MRVRIEFELSPHAKRVLRFAIPAFVLLVGGVAIAGVPHTFNDGDLLSAQAINDDFNSLDSRLSKLEALSAGDGGVGHITVWKDSTGALVPVVRDIGGFGGGNEPYGAAYEVIDPPSGAVWEYYPGNATEIGAGPAMEGFIQSGCTGTAYVFYVPPGRYAFQIASDPSSYYMIPDNAAVTQSAALSWQYPGGQCQNSAIGGPAVLVSSLTKITKPSGPPGTPPYHPEML